MTGRISVLFAPLPSVSGVAKSGKIKLLASTPAERPSVAPDLPTIAESGVKGFDVTLWFGLVAPKGTPRPILVKLANAVQAAGKSEDVKSRLALAGGEPMTLTLDDFGVFLKNDVPKWAAIAKHAGLVPQ
jgi:tripartite-type tricarboxylate transporter receptor subunit TctC